MFSERFFNVFELYAKQILRRKNLKGMIRHGGKTWAQVKNIRSFTRELLRAPRSVGAICPSGVRLAGGMASLIPDSDGLIVEIGAGTGAITEAILKRGVDPGKLLIIERSPELCRILRARFPGLNIVEGDATELSRYLPAGTPVAAIVSSVPLMSLDRKIRAAILKEIRSIVGQYGCVIQYTYAVWSLSPYRKTGFYREESQLVVRNVPPARIECFRRNAK